MRSPRIASSTGVAFLLLAAGSAWAQEGVIPPALLEGTWEVRISSTSYAPDGTRTKASATQLVPLADFAGSEFLMGPFSTGDGQAVPATNGVRFANSFSSSASGTALAGAVKVDPATGQGLSFRASGTLDTGTSIVILKLKGKRIAGSTPPVLLSLFFENFESGFGPYRETDESGSSSSTLWHPEGFCDVGMVIPAGLGTMAAAYNRGDEIPPVYTFNTGDTNEGAIEGPPVAIPGTAPGVQVSFDILRDTEGGSTFDRCVLEVLQVGCGGWAEAAQITDMVGCGDLPLTVTIGPANPTLNSMIGETFAHRFRFDTVDEIANNFFGWYVDNVDIRVVNP